MTLIYDDYTVCWVWVEENNHDIELSPQFDDEDSARLWRTRMIHILSKTKNDF
jgi:hypothetical protein